MDAHQEMGNIQIQKSFESQTVGTLYLVATPIGNLEDMTFRAVRILKEVDEVAAEDTRQTRKLFTHFDIHTKMSSYHEHNQKSAGERLINMLLEGQSIALVSDAGLPAISDPGSELVSDAAKHHIPVVPIPGANAALSALIVSGLSTQQFSFYGFLPRDKKGQEQCLSNLSNRTETLIFYESPHRIVKTLQAMQAHFGDRKVVLARELTKKYEEIVRGSINECLHYLEEHPPRGEYCLIVEGADPESEASWWSALTIEEHVDHYIQNGVDRKQAMKLVATDRGIPKREVYQQVHQLPKQ